MLEAEELPRRVFYGINNVSLDIGINNVSLRSASGDGPAQSLLNNGIKNVSLKSRNASSADALVSRCGLVRVQSIVDRTAQVLRVKRGPSRLVPGARNVRVTPP